MNNCRFCEIIKGKIQDYKIWEDERFLFFLSAYPIKEGHSLLIPKKHIDYIFDLDEETYIDLLKTAKILSEPLKKATNARKIGMGAIGFDIPHTHLHLIPLHYSDEIFNGKLSKKCDPDKLNEILYRIKKYF